MACIQLFNARVNSVCFLHIICKYLRNVLAIWEKIVLPPNICMNPKPNCHSLQSPSQSTWNYISQHPFWLPPAHHSHHHSCQRWVPHQVLHKISHSSDTKSDSFLRTGYFRTVWLSEPFQKADSSAPECIKQWCLYVFIF